MEYFSKKTHSFLLNAVPNSQMFIKAYDRMVDRLNLLDLEYKITDKNFDIADLFYAVIIRGGIFCGVNDLNKHYPHASLLPTKMLEIIRQELSSYGTIEN